MFFVEARYHRSPKRAADQVRYIAHREERLPDGARRELYGIGARYRAFRGDEAAIRKALVDVELTRFRGHPGKGVYGCPHGEAEAAGVHS